MRRLALALVAGVAYTPLGPAADATRRRPLAD